MEEAEKTEPCAHCRAPVDADTTRLGSGAVLCETCRGYLSDTRPAGNDLPDAGYFSDDFPDEAPGYRLLRTLGRGGMSVVFLAERAADGTQVALKVVRHSTTLPQRAWLGCQREMETLRELRHPNIVSLNSFGRIRDGFYIDMEYCSGGSAAQLVTRHGVLPVAYTAKLGLQVLRGLEQAHAQKLVHRDIKPANILLWAAAGGLRAKLGDFGLAKNYELAGDSGLTQTGECGGTYDFMPPDQVVNYKYVRPAADLWGVAATLFYFLTASPPRGLIAKEDPLKAVLQQAPIPLEQLLPGAPAALGALLARGLAFQPEDRFASAAEFGEALAPFATWPAP